ncbi:MAG: chemotaxis protein CheW [Gammaproteobacteria bacterium]
MNDTAQQQDIYSLLVPLNDQRMLIPRANVAEVTGYRDCTPYADAPPWLIGQFTWEKEPVPLVSFEGAIGAPIPEVAARTRILLLRTLTDTLKTRSFGLITQGFPQLVRVNAMVLETDASSTWPPSGPVMCQVKMVNQHPLIPDIEQLEIMLAGALPG